MNIYVVQCNYFNNNYFGAYSSLKRARDAFETTMQSYSNVQSCEDIGDYSYEITLTNGEKMWAEIVYDVLDYEFKDGEI